MILRWTIAALFSLAVTQGTPTGSGTQSATADGVRVVRGQVVTPDAEIEGAKPMRNTMVTLHRVGRDSAGAIDSVRTNATGEYQFRFRVRVDSGGNDADNAIYFASATYGGIAYFTAPFRNELSEGDDAVITVFDTTSVPYPLSVRGRHLIVGSLDSSNTRTVIEVYELSNDSIRTLIAADTALRSATWSVNIPAGARDFRVNETELSSDALVLRDDTVLAFSPFSPGLSQVSFSYTLPAAAFPLSFVTEAPVDVLEVLLEDAIGNVVSDGVTNVGNVNIEGRAFHRFLAQDLPAGHSVLIDLASSRPLKGGTYAAVMLGILGAIMLAAFVRSSSRNRRATSAGRVQQPDSVSGSPVAAPPLHEQLAHEIVQLDAAFAREENVTADARAAYEQERGRLHEALRAALAEVMAEAMAGPVPRGEARNGQ